MLKNFTVSKLVAGVIGLTMVLGVAVTPARSGAATADELQAQIAGLLATINALQAQLAGMGGSGAACSFTFTQNLTVGATGAEVMNLQKFLNKDPLTQVSVSGAGSVGMETSTFGPATKGAVMKFQAKYASEVLAPAGLSAPTGYWGPSSRAKANALCSVVVPPVVVPPPGGTPGSDLEGTDGSISDVNELSSYNNEEVGEGDSDVKVLGMDVEASSDGDIALRSIKISVDPAGNDAGDSDNLDDYIDAITVWMGSTKIGSADADDFTEDSVDVWNKTVTLTNAIVRADETAKIYVTVDAVNTYDSGDIDSDSWTINVENIRFEDGSGVVTTDSTTGDLPDLDVPMDFVSFATAADTELKITLDSSSPEAGIVMISDTSDTDDVVLLKGKLEAEGTSDLVIDEFPVTFTSTGAAVATTTGSVTLKIGTTEFTETMSITVGALTGTVTFDNLDFTIDAGDTVDFTVMADINDIEAGTFDEGDTLLASITASNRELIDAENEQGDQLATGEKSGTATGEAQEFRTSGVSLSLVSTTTSNSAGSGANDDLGTFVIKYKITAVGETVYVSSLADAQLTGNTTGKTTVLVDRAGTATVGGVSVALANVTDADLNAAGLYEIAEGTSETFELTTTVQLPTAGAAGLFRAKLGGVMWDTVSTDETPDSSYTSNLDDFRTSYYGLN